jgi:hypothetical protein
VDIPSLVVIVLLVVFGLATALMVLVGIASAFGLIDRPK